jgi:hypothetical protein
MIHWAFAIGLTKKRQTAVASRIKSRFSRRWNKMQVDLHDKKTGSHLG